MDDGVMISISIPFCVSFDKCKSASWCVFVDMQFSLKC